MNYRTLGNTGLQVSELALGGLFQASALMMGWIGTVELAAHGIAIEVAGLAFMVHLGLSNAATVRIGRAEGEGDPVSLRDGALVAIAMSLVFGLAVVALVTAVAVPVATAAVMLLSTFLIWLVWRLLDRWRKGIHRWIDAEDRGILGAGEVPSLDAEATVHRGGGVGIAGIVDGKAGGLHRGRGGLGGAEVGGPDEFPGRGEAEEDAVGGDDGLESVTQDGVGNGDFLLSSHGSFLTGLRGRRWRRRWPGPVRPACV